MKPLGHGRHGVIAHGSNNPCRGLGSRRRFGCLGFQGTLDLDGFVLLDPPGLRGQSPGQAPEEGTPEQAENNHIPPTHDDSKLDGA